MMGMIAERKRCPQWAYAVEKVGIADPYEFFFRSKVDRPSPRCLLPAKPLTNVSKLRYAHPACHAATCMTGQAVHRANFLCALAHATELAIGQPRDFALRS